MNDEHAPVRTVTFSDGLPGFETCREFQLVSSPDLTPFTIVQGRGSGAPSFVAIDPRVVDPAFSMPLAPADLSRLGSRDDQALVWLAIVAAGGERATVNLRAPLVINPETMRGVQLLVADSDYRLDQPLAGA